MTSLPTTLIRFLPGFGVALAPFFLGSCAEPTDTSTMTAAPMTFTTKHAGSVSVTVTGGSDKAALDASTIVNSDFAEAIKKSLAQSGLFASVVAAGQPEQYQLAAAIVRVDQPEIGRAMTGTIEVNWTLTQLSNKYVFWKKTIVSSYTAKAGEAFSGVDRLRLANEGAARVNIQDALTQISVLPLP